MLNEYFTPFDFLMDVELSPLLILTSLLVRLFCKGFTLLLLLNVTKEDIVEPMLKYLN